MMTLEMRNALQRAFASAQKRANQRGFVLSIADVQALYRNQHGCCAVSGLPFNLQRYDAFVSCPFAPSLDRMSSKGGYTRNNVRLVCTAVNFGLGQWGDEVFRVIAEATVQRQRAIVNRANTQISERIEAAETILPLLNDAEAKWQKRRIAALKRARTLGREGLSAAARKAQGTRRQDRP